MAVITRASLPEEFFDITSAQLLLQPEPQYLHAQMAKLAVASELAVPGAVGFMAGRTAGADGAPYASVNDGRLMLDPGFMGDAILAVADLGAAPGHTIRMNRPKFTNSTYTEAAREVTAGSTISVTPLDVSSEQVAITCKRFAGPMGASVVQPYALDEFDAKMSIHKLAGIIGMNLKRDYDRFLDTVLVALYDVCSSTIYPSGMSADNDAATADAFPLDLDTLYRAEETLDSANVPRFQNGRRVCVLAPRQLRELKSDTQFVQLVQFHKDVNPMFQSYCGSVGNIDLHMSNTLNAPTNSSSVAIYRGQMFGPGKVGMGVGGLPRVLHSTDDNYGLQAKIIWELKAGFANLDNRFGVSVRST